MEKKKQLPYRCAECNESFADGGRLMAHLQEHIALLSRKEDRARPAPRPCCSCLLQCSECPAYFGNSWNLKRHASVHVGQRLLPCPSCSASFPRQDHLRRHFRIHERTSCCERSGARFLSASRLRIPQTTSRPVADLPHTERPAPQPDSDAAPAVLRERQVPPLVVLNLHKCPVCFKTFRHQSMLKAHLLRHASETPFKCLQCPTVFSRMDALKDHEWSVHTWTSSSSKRFQCLVCLKRLASRHLLERHERQHSEKTTGNFECSICGKGFYVESHLLCHQRIHSDKNHSPRHHSALSPSSEDPGNSAGIIKVAKATESKQLVRWRGVKRKEPSVKFEQRSPCTYLPHAAEQRPSFQCPVCKKFFHLLFRLNRHMVVHSGENKKPAVCSVCHESFESNANLSLHMTVHSQEVKGYSVQDENDSVCPVCYKHFQDKSKLLLHLLLHTGKDIQSLKCSVCRMSFVFKIGLERHMLLHKELGKRLFECSVCQKRFQFRSFLKRHILIHTRDRSSKHWKPLNSSADSATQVNHKEEGTHVADRSGPHHKSHKCPTCARMFTLEADLERHLRSHKGEEHFKCLLCGTWFSAYCTFVEHRRTHMAEFSH